MYVHVYAELEGHTTYILGKSYNSLKTSSHNITGIIMKLTYVAVQYVL